jgi:hypothetical protein
MTAINPWTGPQWKQGRVAAKKAKQKNRRKRVATERENKAEVRRRDKVCRFPRCGCRRLGEILKAFGEVSHTKHKGPGGDPSGVRSGTENMVLICKWRHQDAPFSRHKQTIRVVYLTADGFDGLVAWEINWGALQQRLLPPQERTPYEDDWRELARETAIGQWEKFTDWQEEILDELAGMEC